MRESFVEQAVTVACFKLRALSFSIGRTDADYTPDLRQECAKRLPDARREAVQAEKALLEDASPEERAWYQQTITELADRLA